MAYLIGADLYLSCLRSVRLCSSYVASNLTAVNLSQADLTNANFGGAYGYNVNEEFTSYPGADLTDANLSQANAHECELLSGHADRREPHRGRSTGSKTSLATLLYGGTGITAAQLYSTASYQAHDLTGIRLDGNNLAGVNLAGQNLTNADFDLRHADQCQSQPSQPHECELLSAPR